jgi:glycogen debranching enzyme
MFDQLSNSALLLTRHNPLTHQSVLLIAHTSFDRVSEKWEKISLLSIEGLIDEILFEASINHPYEKESIKDFKRSLDYINGLEQTKIYLKENLLLEESRYIRLITQNSGDYIHYRIIQFTDEFRPGSIIALKISLLPEINQSLIHLREFLTQFSNPSSEFNCIVKQLTLIDLERVLYRSSIEEQSDGKGFDVYSIPDYGKLHYCGLQGIMSVLEKIRLQNNLQHPLIVNLKQGNWLMDYISTRLKSHPNTKQVCYLHFRKKKTKYFFLFQIFQVRSMVWKCISLFKLFISCNDSFIF